MKIVTLTTDLGTDYYNAALKGALFSQCPEATIVDVSHHISKYNIVEAAFVLKNTYREFPKGTIHIIGVKPEVTDESVHVGVLYDGHYFIGADNGIFSLLLDGPPEKVVALNIFHDAETLTFPTKDIFVKAASHLVRGGTLEVIGNPKTSLLERQMYQAVTEENSIRGAIIYVDSYGNVVSNITETLFKQVGRGREFVVSTKVSRYNIHKISSNYSDVTEGERLAFFGASGYLEIAMNIGHASNLLGLHINDTIRIDFKNS